MSRRARTLRCIYFPLSIVSLALLGCSSNNFKNPTNLHLDGVAMGGQQPIRSSTLQLYAVNTSSPGPTYTSVPLLPVGAAALTSSDGSGNATNSNANAGNNYNSLPAGYFTITGDFTCPSPGAPVYLAAKGGNPAQSVGANNSDIAILLALGACGQLSGSTNVQMNEVTTVGSVAALFPYMTAYNAVGSPSANADYLAEEFIIANEYMNPATGGAPGASLPAGYYASTNEVNTLANLLATCVNTEGGTAGDGTACGNILLAATPPGKNSTSPTDTVGLLIDILNNPTNNVGGIYRNIGTTPQFFPYDLSAPSDWTLPILPAAQTPTASPAAGTYAGTQSVTLQSPTSGATIYYTTDGTTPTTSSSMYTGPVTVSTNETLKAIAGISRGGVSAAGAFGYNITGVVATPVISLAGGTYRTPQVYTITSATPDAAVYITTDGTTPGPGSTPVTGSLQLIKTETVKAIAFAGSLKSGLTGAAFTYAPTSGTIDTFAGGSIGELNDPTGVAVDVSGNLYIADQNNHLIRKVTAATGQITTVAGNGTGGYTGDGVAATSSALYYPAGVAVDASGNLYIADYSNNRIRMVTASTGAISTIAGGGTGPTTCTGSTDSIGDGCVASSAMLNGPFGVVLNAGGDLYISEQNSNRVRKVTAATGIITTVAGNGTAGYTADGVAAASSELCNPDGLAVDAGGNLFIADSCNHRVRKVTATTGLITTVAGNGTRGFNTDQVVATGSELNYPYGVAVDASGNLIIADHTNQRIREVPAATGIISTVAGNGTPCTTSTTSGCMDGGAATSGELSNPPGVAVDTSGNLYIADAGDGLIRKVTAAGVITTVAGNGTQGYVPALDGIAATASTLGSPAGGALDASGNLYIVDTLNSRIRMVTASTGVITTVAGTGTQCTTSSTTGCGDGGAATSAQLYDPHGVAVDASGNLYIADTLDNRIRMVTASTGVITTVAGTGTPGFSGDTGQATAAMLKQPFAVAVDASGNLYIADTANYRIREVAASGGVISTIAGTGTACTTSATTGCADGVATSALINNVLGLALDASGNLYLADDFDNRIRRLKVSTGNLSTFAGTGVQCTTSSTTGCLDGNSATTATLSQPAGVSFDASGNLYIADSTDQLIRKVSASTGKISTVAGNGTAGFSGDTGAATAAEINTPSGVAVDASGRLYIMDRNNNRVRVVYP